MKKDHCCWFLVSVITVFLLTSALLLSPQYIWGSETHGGVKQIEEPTCTQYVEGEVIVTFRAALSEAQVKKLLISHGYRDYKRIVKEAPSYVVKYDKLQDIKDVIRELLLDDNIINASPNYIGELSDVEPFVPNDPELYRQWGLWLRTDPNGGEGSINATEAWGMGLGDEGVVVAVLDSGVDTNHPDLRDKLLPGFNCVDDRPSNDVTDDMGHGTHVAGIVAASTNNGKGVAGVAGPCPNVKIMPVRIVKNNDEWNSVDVIEGIYWAVNNGADVISMSFEDENLLNELQKAIEYAYGHGCTLVAASGNHDVFYQPIKYPAAFDTVISVGSNDRDGWRSGFSNFNKKGVEPVLDMVAPGNEIYSTYIDGYTEMRGTSMACPHVSGAAAFLLSHNNNLRPNLIKHYLTSTAHPPEPYPGSDIYEKYPEQYGAGILDLSAATTKLESLPDTVPQLSQWYLPEGSTNGFEEWICIQNPTDQQARVVIEYVTPTGQSQAYDFVMQSNSRTTVPAHEQIGGEISARVYSDCDIYVERAMYWWSRMEGHVSHAIQEPELNTAHTWYVPEGAKGYPSGFRTYICIQNPNDSWTGVEATYLGTNGELGKRAFDMPPKSRYTISLEDENCIPNNSDVSTIVSADDPSNNILVERAMYWRSQDGKPAKSYGGSCAAGLPKGNTEWYLAEGCTGYGFETWVLIQNPTSENALINMFLMSPQGEIELPPFTLPAKSRKTIRLNDHVQDQDVATRIESDEPAVVVERSMYWDNPSDQVKGPGHSSEGVRIPAMNWHLAEGSTEEFQTWVLVQNPNSKGANIDFQYMTSSGPVQGPQFYMEPHTRRTINVADTVPNNSNVSTVVTGDVRVVAERAMYWTKNEGNKGGTESIGIAENPVPDTPAGIGVWVILPEGEVTFSQVISSGTTVVVEGFEHRPDGPPLGYLPVCEGTYYHLATTAEHRGNIDIDLNYFGLPDGVPTEYIRLLFYNEDTGTWSDITTGVDPERKVVKGTAGSTGIFCVAVPVTVEVHPETLNLNSQGRWITTYIGLPEGYDAGGIDVKTVRLKYGEHVIDAQWGNVEEDGRLMVKFDRAAVSAILPVADEVELFISGEFQGVLFRASDHIRVISPGK